jgi:hypothetical protein
MCFSLLPAQQQQKQHLSGQVVLLPICLAQQAAKPC